MNEILEVQKQSFIENGPPSHRQRVDSLRRCIALIEKYEKKFTDALNQDFSNRSKDEIKITEIDQTIRNLSFNIKNLKNWMKPKKRRSSLGLGLVGGKSYLAATPLGSVGIIAPWNFPVSMIFYPAASIFAAGNKIMAKPSEITPYTADVIKAAVEEYFDKSEFSVILGGPAVGKAFSSLPLDHLLYTGSNVIAKKVLQNTAKNLVPTTLELGGKSPAIISRDANLKLAAKRILFAKTMNAGQICLAPDYIFLKKGLQEKFLDELKNVFESYYPPENQNDYTSMVNAHHYERMKKYIDDAISKGAIVVPLGQGKSENPQTILTTLILETKKKMDVMKNEIFGPLLPILLYEDLTEVVKYINLHDRPLGLYFFGNEKSEQNYVINNTRSGGVTINDTLFHILQSRLPFGGVGESGYGCYHGYEGFLNFSNLRSIYYQTHFDSVLSVMRPPRNKNFDKLSKFLRFLG